MAISSMSRTGATRCLSLALVLAVTVVCVTKESRAASFQGLGDLPGGTFDSRGYAVSADGSTAVGVSAGSGEAFRWTSAAGMSGLGDLDGGAVSSSASGVSGDGSVVVGHGTSSTGPEPVRWSGGSLVSIGVLPGGYYGYAWRTSQDGSVIVGWSESANGLEAFRWTDSGGMVGLGFLPGGFGLSYAFGVSGDGSTVVGVCTNASYTPEAFRWTDTDGMTGLGFISGDSYYSEARAISGDGTTAVGENRSSSGGIEAFRWTAAAGITGLGDLPGGDIESRAYGVSYDGSVVVGYGTSSSGERAFVWDAAGGMRELGGVLVADYGLDLSGWRLTAAYDVSADGRTIVGVGTNPSGDTEAWIADLTTVCNDGVDNDGDGSVDYPSDPGCKSVGQTREAAQCQDGIDNDADGALDFDGGASLNGGVPFGTPDPQCAGKPWRNVEVVTGCGLGVELIALLPILGGYRRRQRSSA